MRTRLLVLIAVLGVGAVVTGWIYESRLSPPAEVQQLEVPDNIDYFLANLNYRAIDERGRLEYEFRSPRLEHYPRDDVSRIETPSVDIYGNDGEWRVDALEGEFHHAENLLRLSREVVMNRSGDRPLRVLSERVRFEPERDLVSSEASIVMLSDQGRVEAEQGVFDLAGKVYRFSNSRTILHDAED
jgi:lipopolysaccharide export system protein LptC